MNKRRRYKAKRRRAWRRFLADVNNGAGEPSWKVLHAAMAWPAFVEKR